MYKKQVSNLGKEIFETKIVIEPNEMSSYHFCNSEMYISLTRGEGLILIKDKFYNLKEGKSIKIKPYVPYMVINNSRHRLILSEKRHKTSRTFIQNHKMVYGPVSSRYLGVCLGIEALPPRTCTFNCIYCEFGPMRNIISTPFYFSNGKEIAQSVERRLEKIDRGVIDYIAFSGSGEPTLNLAIGDAMNRIKRKIDIPIAIITNSSLLNYKKVRENLLLADTVRALLDTGNNNVFERINRPHPSISFKRLVNGIIKFSQKFNGILDIKIMLVDGYNCDDESIKSIKEIVGRIHYTRIELNIPSRKGQVAVKSPSSERIKEILSILPNSEFRSDRDRKEIFCGIHYPTGLT